MKPVITLFIFTIFVFSCQEIVKKEKPVAEDSSIPGLEDLDWILGSWKRINDDEGRQTFEIWKKETDQVYRGLGYTLVEEDTVFKEDLNILFKDGKVNYKVSGVNKSPTNFEFIGQTENAFACENTSNDFPQRIEYIYQNDTIYATIMAGETSIVFVFIRK